MAAWQYPVTEEQRQAVEAERTARAAEVEVILLNPVSDPEAVARARSPEGSLESESMRLAIDAYLFQLESGITVMDTYVQRLGLARAAAVCVASAMTGVDYGHLYRAGVWDMALVTWSKADESGPAGRRSMAWKLTGMLEHLRRLLAMADEDVSAAAVALLEPLRELSLTQRILTS